MDDSCAVCAEALEWVAYGACGHKEVCSTCVARLRFICDDRNCCICKTQCDVVFVTKALGDYTKVIKEFSVLPSEPREGRLGPYWYHEDTQAFFDDVDHYKMIKAMCKLSCSECDKLEEQPKESSKRRARFRNIEQLKNHLYHQHRLSMCPLCLEMRKVFICEQKLYTRAQLKQHISTGDSEVDGSESERGGFMGHPMCEFCRTPFYGDNELYTHMGTEHYKCHLCHSPGQYEYYRNYDDLEMHFRQGHFLCEDESCLAKKFVVFQSEAEMKRHNTVEHAGRMSRSRRNAALQIPTSFRYRRSNEQDNRRGRGRTFRRDSSDNELSMAIEASLERPNAVDNAFHNPSSDTSENDPIINQVESSSTTDAEGASRYLQAVGGLNSSNAPLHNLAFPPLAPGSSQSTPQPDSDGLPNNTMAAYLRRKNNQKVAVKPVKPVISSGQAWPAAGRSHVPPAKSVQAWPTTNVAHGVPPANSAQAWPTTNVASLVSRGSGQNKKAFGNKPGPSSYASSAQAPSSYASSAQAPSSYASSAQAPSSYASSAQAQVETRQTTVPGLSSINTSRDSFSSNSSRISHSASAPNLVENGSVPPSILDFPPVSVAQVRKFPSTSQPPSQPVLEVGNVQSANKSLVEKIRAAVEFDEEKFTVFKDISAQYRQGLVDTEVYLDFVQQFGLLHLVLDLARLCPDAQKQRELINAYNTSMRSNGAQENGWPQGSLQLKDSKKGKGKSSDAENSSSKNTMVKGKWKISEAENSNSKNTLADSIMNSVRELQLNYRPSEEVVEVLSKDGYRPAKGKSKLIIDEQEEQIPRSQPPRGQKDPVPAGSGSNVHLGDGGGGSKQRKKTSKFHRVRLGEGSAAAILDLRNSNSDPQPDTGDGSSKSTGALPARGVWKTKPATKLFT